MVKNPPTDAGDTGLIPDLGRSSMLWSNEARAPRLLSLCPRSHAPRQESRRNEKPTHRN